MLAGEWRVERSRDKAAATLVVEPFEPVSPADGGPVEAEGLELLRFVAPDSAPTVIVLEPMR